MLINHKCELFSFPFKDDENSAVLPSQFNIGEPLEKTSSDASAYSADCIGDEVCLHYICI